MGVICVVRFLSSVAVFFGHLLSLSFEGKDSVVQKSHLWRAWLAPLAVGREESGVSHSVALVQSRR